MFISKDSLKIKINQSDNYISIGQYIVEAEYQYNKLWSSDSGRNLAGTQSGTLVGIFPKIVVQFRKLTKSELELLAPILDAPRQYVSFYDATSKTQLEMVTYTGDWKVTNKNIVNSSKKNEGFQISFIAVRRR